MLTTFSLRKVLLKMVDVHDDLVDFKLTKKQAQAVTSSERFKLVATKEDIDTAISNAVPDKTNKQTRWAFSVFEAWCTARQEIPSLCRPSPHRRLSLKNRCVDLYWSAEDKMENRTLHRHYMALSLGFKDTLELPLVVMRLLFLPRMIPLLLVYASLWMQG